jgi:hypothetical protein
MWGTMLKAKSSIAAMVCGLFNYLGCDSLHEEGHVKKKNNIMLPQH